MRLFRKYAIFILIIIGAGLYQEYQAGPFSENATGQNTYFEDCGTANARFNCVVDGDTIYSSGIKIRISDIDTPEIFSPKCDSELQLGMRAKHRLMELINRSSFDIVASSSRDEDRYGRKLRELRRDGKSLGSILVEEGLARKWGGKRMPWC